MHEASKAKYINQILCILADVRDDPGIAPSAGVFHRYQALTHDIDERIKRTQVNLVGQLNEVDEFRDKFSDEALQRTVEGTIDFLLTNPDAEPQAFIHDTLSNLQQYSAAWRTYYPLAGIELCGLANFTLGRCTIAAVDEAYVARGIQEMNEALAADPTIEEAEAQRRLERYQPAFELLAVQHDTYAVMEVVGDLTHARVTADRELQQMIELLRYGTLVLGSHTLNGLDIGVLGDHDRGPRNIVTIPRHYEGGAIKAVNPRASKLYVGQEELDMLHDAGIFAMAELARKTKPTKFEGLLLDAVHWCADATTQADSDNTFLGLFICVETLLKPPRGRIAKVVARRAGILVQGNSGTKQWTRDCLMELYRERSDIAHSAQVRSAWQHSNGREEIVRGTMGDIIEKAGMTVGEFMPYLK